MKIIILFISLTLPVISQSLIVGVRGGAGFKSKDRFDSTMKKFTSTTSPDITQTNYSHPKKNYNRELFLKKKLPAFYSYSKNSYIGFNLGNVDWQDFHVKNITSEPFFTYLDFEFKTQFINFTYHYLWYFNRFSLEIGGGFGFSQAFFKTNGYSLDGSEVMKQNGIMIGNGVNYRIEFLFNRPISLRNYLQFGFITHHTLIPELTGSFNGKSASYFVSQEGEVALLLESSNRTKVITSEAYATRLGVSSTSFLLTFGLFHRLQL